MVYFKSEKSLPAIEKLSQIMQFTTYEAQKEKIPLSGEINYIRAYIELEKLRHQEESFVILDIETVSENREIPPYILSPLVENALKHGVMSDETPVRIDLKADNRKLVFCVVNKIGTQKKDKLGGIGLDNLKKRLEIYYPGTHSLEISSENQHFTAKLEIELK
jgi:LytS/YehU family sensor histidine kinase